MYDQNNATAYLYIVYDLDNITDYPYDLFISFFRCRPLEYAPPEEIADACTEARATRLPKMEQALLESACSLGAWVPDAQDIEDEEVVVLSK